jgi:hypothetical protein
MFALFGAKFTAVGSACGRHFTVDSRFPAAIALAAGLLSAALPSSAALAGGDPADPRAKVKGVTYRSTIAPYSSLRPVAPAPWRERNDGVAPPNKPDHEERAR